MKKIIAAAVSAGMILTAVPFNAHVFAKGTEIGTPEELIEYFDALRSGARDDAVLIDDIDLSELVSADEPMAPIPAFSGELDGAGHSVKGLYISSDESAALFEDLTGTVKDVALEGTVSAKDAAGVAVNNNGTISGVKTAMKVFGRGNAAGMAINNNGEITGSDNMEQIKVTDDGGLAAGIACVNGSVISDSANYGEIAGRTQSGGARFTGGICALSTGRITGCANTGKINGGELSDTDNSGISPDTNVGGAGGIAGTSGGGQRFNRELG